MNTDKIEISALVKADKEKVWNYYTKPEHIVNWNFASDDWCSPWAKNDLRKGGQYTARMEAKDGSFGFDFESIYNEVVAEEKLDSTMPDGRQIVTTFQPQENGTLVTTVFDAETQNPIEMQKNGWQAILNNFKNYTESN